MNSLTKSIAQSPITNTEILMYVLGWQGGTIHQVVDVMMEVYAQVNHDREQMDRYKWDSYIIDADPETMRQLVRLAQIHRNRKQIEAFAKPARDEYVPEREICDYDGIYWLTFRPSLKEGEYLFDAYQAMPTVLNYKNRKFVKVSHNSDAGHINYKLAPNTARSAS